MTSEKEDPLSSQANRAAQHSKSTGEGFRLFTRERRLTDSETEANEYLEKHKILDIFSIVTSSLIYHRPFNSRRHISEYLNKLKQARDEYTTNRNMLTPHGPEHPLFNDSVLRSLFNASDPSGTGQIPIKSCISLALALGIDNAEETFHERTGGHGFCVYNTFESIIKELISRHSATFYDVKEKYKTNL